MNAPAPAPAETRTLPPQRRRLRLPQLPKWVDSAFVVAGLGLLIWVVSRYPLAEVGGACRRLGLPVLWVLLLPLGWHASGAGAVWVLFGKRIAWRKILWARLAAEAYNSLFFSIGGEPFRVRFLSRFVPTDQVLATLIRDRVLEMTSGYFVSATFLLLGLRHYPLAPSLRVALGVYAAVTVALALAGTALVLTRLPGRAGAFIFRAVGGSTAALPATLPAKTVLTVLPFYVVSRALGVLEIGVLLHLLGGRLSLTEAGFFDGVLNFAGTVGFFLPGALGVFEGTSVLMFKVLGLGGAQGIVFGLVRRARMLLMSAAGVALHWLGRQALASSAASPSPSSWKQALRRHAYTLFCAPRGIGRPQPVTQWDGEYSDGKWRKLDSAAQLGHYALIAAYVSHLYPEAPRIADVGCGHGRLFQLLQRSGFRQLRRSRRLSRGDPPGSNRSCPPTRASWLPTSRPGTPTIDTTSSSSTNRSTMQPIRCGSSRAMPRSSAKGASWYCRSGRAR